MGAGLPVLRLSEASVTYLRDTLGIHWSEGDPAPMLPDGVWLGLPEELYFLQPALGSSDLADLWLYKEGWWWKSPNNPWWVDPRKKAMVFGSATHTLLLEGREAFESRYAVQPDPRHFPDLLVTVDDLLSALQHSDAPGVHPRLKKKDMVDLAKVYLPGRHVWDAILEKFERQSRGREVITAEERWVLEVMLESATADPAMHTVVTAAGGVALAEVSVFWTLPDGVRLRFRFDSLLPSINADLKTLGNTRDRNLAGAVGKRIGDSALDVQAAMSFVARRRLYEYVAAKAELVFGGTEDQRAWLRRFPAEAPLNLGDKAGWSWLWMFYQKPDQDGRAPVIFPAWMNFGSSEHRDGHRKAAHGLAFYRDQVAKVGLSKAWTRVERVHYMDPKKADRVEIPHWIDRPMAVADEEEALAWQG